MRFLKLFISAAALSVFSCDLLGPEKDGELDNSAEKSVVVATSDYVSGNISLISCGDFSVAKNCLSVHSDNAVRVFGGSIYLLERYGADNILRIDGGTVFEDSIKYQKSLGSSVNIHDIAFIDKNKAYVTRYNNKSLAIIDLKTGEKTGSIDLSKYSHEGEEVPYMDGAVVVGDMCYVTCQRLKTFQGEWGPYPGVGDLTGMVVVISTETDEVVDEIELKYSNPYDIDTANGNLYVCCSGAMGVKDGAVEAVSLSSNKLKSGAITEEDLGGDVTGIVMTGPEKGYVAVAKNSSDFAEFWTDAVEVDLSEYTVNKKVKGIDDACSEMVFDGEYLYIGDRSTENPGVFVIDPSDNSRVAGPLDVGLPPSSFALYNE